MIRLIGGATSEKKGEGTADILLNPFVIENSFAARACVWNIK